ncbi:MAG: DUF2304 domain-containing protein [Lachnospiraceae bacterium]|nr:DUF2304 domain-containing protein [Lachnospiraceae bacterium]
MDIVMYMKLAMGAAGIFFLCLSFWEYVKKKLTEEAGLAWGLFAILLIVWAIWPGALSWCADLSPAGLAFLSITALFLAAVLFWQSMAVSKLIRKNQELAMQVSLLNQENEQILTELKMIPAKGGRGKRDGTKEKEKPKEKKVPEEADSVRH